MNNDDGIGAFPVPGSVCLSYRMQHAEKVRQVLQKLLQPRFRISSDEYLSSLLSYLAINNFELGCPLLSSPIYTDWLIKAKESWSNLVNFKPSTDSLSFALQLAALISTNEPTFVYLDENQVYSALTQFLIPISECASSLKLAFLKLLNVLVDYDKGLAWILEHSYWKQALELSLTEQCLDLTKEAYDFLGNLMVKTSKSNRAICDEIIGIIMVPFDDCALQSLSTEREVNEDDLCKALEPTLRLLDHLLCAMIEEVVETRNVYFYLTIKSKYKLEKRIAGFLAMTQSEAFSYELQKVQLVLMMHDSLVNMDEQNMLNGQETLSCAVKMLDMFSNCLNKGQISNMLKIIYRSGLVWEPFKNKVQISDLDMEKTLCYSTDPLTFVNQLFLLQVIPIFFVSVKMCNLKDSDFENNDIRMDYCTKLFKMAAAPVWRFLYRLRDSLEDCPRIFEYATLALEFLIKSKQFYDKDLGVSSFQALMYILCDIVTILKKEPKLSEVLLVESEFTVLLLDAIAQFIQDFKITWRDSIESIDVMDIALDFLSMPQWPPQFVVKALKLVEISISKYMAPNMALLVDEFSDSTMSFTGPLIYTKLNDVQWEVRAAALEVLRTISHNAYTKFPSFQKMILDYKLPSLAVKMALHDDEGCVRANALKCLQEMMQVHYFCADIAEKYNLNNKIVEILRCESEGIVRMEAATLMAINYELDRLPSGDFLDGVYDVMSHAATSDLHWEVKKNALHFWQIVINQHLQQQGMIDGSFPNVVFSKEHRKIINLTEEEVRKRLLKVLDRLSAIGCLYVLVNSIQNESDLAVTQVAIKLTKDLCKLLDKYEVCDVVKPLKEVSGLCVKKMKFDPASMQHDKNSRPMDTSGDVINRILDTNDRVLIEGASMSNNKSTEDHCNGIIVKQRIVLSSRAFLEFVVNEDLDAILNSKHLIKQIDQVGSLLNKILKENNPTEDVNSMDCC